MLRQEEASDCWHTVVLLQSRTQPVPIVIGDVVPLMLVVDR